jgi:hypothetical protein
MKKMFVLGVVLIVISSFLASCTFALAGSAPTATPTVEKRKPTETSTTAPPAQTLPTDTPASAPVLSLPSTFDITLAITNLTCGAGATVEHPYTFTIDGTSLALLQVDADITTTGTYDPVAGAFATSAVVGPGTEAYTGVITFDGTTITVTGGNSYTQEGQCTYTGSIAGTTTVP